MTDFLRRIERGGGEGQITMYACYSKKALDLEQKAKIKGRNEEAEGRGKKKSGARLHGKIEKEWRGRTEEGWRTDNLKVGRRKNTGDPKTSEIKKARGGGTVKSKISTVFYVLKDGERGYQCKGGIYGDCRRYPAGETKKINLFWPPEGERRSECTRKELGRKGWGEKWEQECKKTEGKGQQWKCGGK